MDDDIEKLINEANWDKLMPELVNYADNLIRRYGWRGFSPRKGPRGQLLANDKNADDFSQEAIRRLLDGRRKWNPDKVDLLGVLKGTIKSIISSEYKSLENRSLKDWVEDPNKLDPISNAADPKPNTDVLLDQKFQRQTYEAFKEWVSNDTELSNYLEALELTHLPREIEELTKGEIKATRAYELKRKLNNKVDTFFTKSDFHNNNLIQGED